MGDQWPPQEFLTNLYSTFLGASVGRQEISDSPFQSDERSCILQKSTRSRQGLQVVLKKQKVVTMH